MALSGPVSDAISGVPPGAASKSIPRLVKYSLVASSATRNGHGPIAPRLAVNSQYVAAGQFLDVPAFGPQQLGRPQSRAFDKGAQPRETLL
jgi:hypothetical protein